MAPTMPADGRVISQAAAIRPATPQRTSAPGLPTPLPRMEPVATWVVDSEKPKWLDSRMIAAEEVSAAMPCGDLISTRPLPSVRMTRQPPRYVPSAKAEAQEATTHRQGRAVALT